VTGIQTPGLYSTQSKLTCGVLKTLKVLIIPGKYSFLEATIFKHVILAWMPESSATDGSYIIISNIFHNTVSHPCDWIPASLLE